MDYVNVHISSLAVNITFNINVNTTGMTDCIPA